MPHSRPQKYMRIVTLEQASALYHIFDKIASIIYKPTSTVSSHVTLTLMAHYASSQFVHHQANSSCGSLLICIIQYPWVSSPCLGSILGNCLQELPLLFGLEKHTMGRCAISNVFVKRKVQQNRIQKCSSTSTGRRGCNESERYPGGCCWECAAVESLREKRVVGGYACGWQEGRSPTGESHAATVRMLRALHFRRRFAVVSCAVLPQVTMPFCGTQRPFVELPYVGMI